MIVKTVFVGTLALATLFATSSAEVYSSEANMKDVFALERELIGVLENYAQKMQNKLNRINGYLDEVHEALSEKESSESDDEFSKRVLGNPIHMYKLIRRLTVDWDKIVKDIKDDDWSDTEFELKRRKLSVPTPKEEDLQGSAQALVRLQDIYDLKVRELSQGEISHGFQSFKTNALLTAQDCLFIGKVCFNTGSLARSIEWFEEAWVIARLENNRTLNQNQVEHFLHHAAKIHDEKVMKGERGPNLFPRPVYEESPSEQRKKIKVDANDVVENPEQTDDLTRFTVLCRGEEIRPLAYVAQLKCRLSHVDDPYYYIQPVKIEEKHKNPDILLFHEVVSPKEMETIREISGPMLMRSQVQGSGPGDSEVSYVRTSKTGWLQDSHHPVVRKLTERVSWMTRLNTDTWNDDAELLQVANYLNAGHYNPHHDYVMKDTNPDMMITLPHKGLYIGDRIATWMFYMNEVTAGGRTVFPRIGAGVEPVAGSAVFWYNLHKSGDPDRRTLHGACPILYGTKWVSNKWIREGAQLFARPCGLTRDEI